MRKHWLLAAGLLALLGGLVHLAIPLGGPEWYAFFGAPPPLVEMAAAGALRPILTCVLIAAVLFVVAAYAFSGLGMIRRLPALRLVLGLIGLGLLARGVGFVGVALWQPQVLAGLCGKCGELNLFLYATSGVCAFIGIGYLMGAFSANEPELG